MATRTRRVRALWILFALLTACAPVPSPGPDSPGPVVSGAPTASSSVPTDGPAASPATFAPTAAQLIIAAVEAGRLDEFTGLLHRLQAVVGDDRLPREYAGSASEDTAAMDLAVQRWTEFTREQQDALLPYLVRPTSPQSFWAPADDGSATTGMVTLASTRAAATCSDGLIREQVSPSIPVVVWGFCGGVNASSALARVGEVVAYMGELWGPMTAYLGEPIGDQNIAGDRFLDTPETGDGMLDIYLVDRSLTLHGRNLSTGASGVAPSAPPLVGPVGASATSTYIVVSSAVPGGPALKSTLAHEFFHSLQAAHNRTGLVSDGRHFWFVEASAVWAEHRFVPEARETEAHLRFRGIFQYTEQPLGISDGQNEYASWVWPFFVEREAGPGTVAAIWAAFEGIQGRDALTGVLDGALPFREHFREFAVQAYNGSLSPGDPVPRLDEDLPVSPPGSPRLVEGPDIGVEGDESPDRAASIPGLWSGYWHLKTQEAVRRVTFDFSGLAPSGTLDVDLLVKPSGKPWERRKASTGETEICDVEQVIVVLSNHATSPDQKVEGTWQAKGEPEVCTQTSWKVEMTGQPPGGGTYSGTGDVMCTLNAGQWSVHIDAQGSGLRLIDASEASPRSVTVYTGLELEGNADWFVSEFFDGTLSFQGDPAADPPTIKVVGDTAVWDDRRIHIELEATCTTFFRL